VDPIVTPKSQAGVARVVLDAESQFRVTSNSFRRRPMAKKASKKSKKKGAKKSSRKKAARR
jgi:hypothetical protein